MELMMAEFHFADSTSGTHAPLTGALINGMSNTIYFPASNHSKAIMRLYFPFRKRTAEFIAKRTDRLVWSTSRETPVFTGKWQLHQQAADPPVAVHLVNQLQ